MNGTNQVISRFRNGTTRSEKYFFYGYLCLGIVIFGTNIWIYLFPRDHKLTAEKTHAQEVAAYEAYLTGEWDSVFGGRKLVISRENHICKVTETDDHKKVIESDGRWHLAGLVVCIEASGNAGSYDLKMQCVPGDTVEFLAPSPASSALLAESFVRISEPEAPDDGDYGGWP
jgi:hypothetical protein